MRLILIAAIVLLTNITWIFITTSNGKGIAALAEQRIFTRLILGVIETAVLVELSFYVVWTLLGSQKMLKARHYILSIFLLIVAIVIFSLGFSALSTLSISGFLSNFISDITVTTLSVFVFYVIIQKNRVNLLMVEKEKILEEKAGLAEANAIAQTDAMNMRIDNHFFFNSLNILAALIPEDPQKAEDFLLELTDAHRIIFMKGSAKAITIEEELKLLSSYMKMTRYRFGEESILLSMADEISDRLDEHIIPLSLLHAVENAIKHNSYSKQNPLRINICLEKAKDDTDYITITNNKQEKISKALSTKQGLENIKKKYQLVSGQAPVIENNPETFTVKLPIIKKWTF